jgi:hypothetical protein
VKLIRSKVLPAVSAPTRLSSHNPGSGRGMFTFVGSLMLFLWYASAAMSLRSFLLTLRSWVRSLNETTDERIRPSPIPEKLKVVVAYDPDTAETIRIEADRNHNVQVAIAEATNRSVRIAGFAFGGTMILLLLNLVQFVFVFRQTRRSEEFIKLDERAWLQIAVEKAGNDFVAGTQSKPVAFRYFLRVHNYGKTAAQSIEYKTAPSPMSSIRQNESQDFVNRNQNILQGKVPSAKDIPVNQPGPRNLVPNSDVPVPIATSGQPPQVFASDQWVSYIVGRVDYKDVFGNPHWYTFCYYVVNDRGDLRTCFVGNDSN